MAVRTSEINTRSTEFAENAAAMQLLVDDLQAKVEQVAQGGGTRYQERHQARGKLLPRDRVNALVDPGRNYHRHRPRSGSGVRYRRE